MGEIIPAGSVELDKAPPQIVRAGSIELDKAQPSLATGPTIQSWKGPSMIDRIFSLFENPEKERARAVQALVDADTFKISPSAAYQYRDAIDAGEKLNPERVLSSQRTTTMQRVNQAVDIGVKQKQLGLIGHEYIMTGDPKYLEQMRSIKMPSEAETFIPESTLESAFLSAAKMLPIMAHTGIESTKTGLASGMAVGGAMALMGPAAPVSVPVGTAAGFAAGATSRAYIESAKVEGGLAMFELINMKDKDGNPLDLNLARAAAFGIGQINGAIEVLQLGTLAKSIPGFKKMISRSILETITDKTVKEKLASLALSYGKNITTETGQELAQESTNIVFEEFAKKVNNNASGTKFDKATVDDVVKRLYETASEAAKGFSVFMAPGTVVKAGATVMPARQAATQQTGTQANVAASTVPAQVPGLAGIGRFESGGAYTAEHNVTGAYGKYQIMPTNWGPWSKEAGLPDGSQQTPENQEIVANFKYNQYMQRFGDDQLAATAWFAGPGAAQRLMNGDMTVLEKKDVNGTTVAAYIKKTTGREFGVEGQGTVSAPFTRVNVDDVARRVTETEEDISLIANDIFRETTQERTGETEQAMGNWFDVPAGAAEGINVPLEGKNVATGQADANLAALVVEKAKAINETIGNKGSIDLTPIVELGRSIWQEGHQTVERFTTRAKEVLGDAWEKVKDLIRQAWDVINNESGKITVKGPKQETLESYARKHRFNFNIPGHSNKEAIENGLFAFVKNDAIGIDKAAEELQGRGLLGATPEGYATAGDYLYDELKRIVAERAKEKMRALTSEEEKAIIEVREELRKDGYNEREIEKSLEKTDRDSQKQSRTEIADRENRLAEELLEDDVFVSEDESGNATDQGIKGESKAPGETGAKTSGPVQIRSEKEFTDSVRQAETQAVQELKQSLAKAEKALASAQKNNKQSAIEKTAEKIKSIKTQIREITGQARQPKTVTEMEALSAALKKAAQASREAYKAGNKAALRQAVEKIRTIKQDIARFVGQRSADEVTVKEYDALKAAFTKAAQASRIAYREGNKAGVAQAREQMTQALNRLDWIKNRRERIKMARDYFGLTDAELKTIDKKNPLLMDDRQFNRYMAGIERKAWELAEKKQALLELTRLISDKRLQKVDNYRQALDFPPIKDMTTEQMREFAALLEPFEEGDVFLTKRELETVDRTGLAGIRTWREALEALAKEVGVPPDTLINIHPSWRDNFRWDTALREQNPFYDLLVTSMTREMLNAEARYFEIETEANKLAKASEKSRNRSLTDRAIPQDKQIMEYLEADDEAKKALAKEMTDEQLRYATFIQQYFSKALEYLIATKALQKGRENYFVHIRRSFLENVKDEGLMSAFKNLFKNYAQDEAVFNILDDDTGNILPLEKFFQFALHRTGELMPTANVTMAFLTYVRTFEKKVSLDSIIPKIQIYTQALTPQIYTPRGLEFDASLKKFVNKWVNNKKGRKISYDSVIKQGGPLDLGITAMRTFLTLLDLGLNIPVGIASFVGEQVATLEMLGMKDHAKGTARIATEKGKKIIEEYRSFIGRSFWEHFTEPGRELPSRLSDLMFGLFHASNVTANKQFLLGSLTEAEYESGKISPERLALLKLEMGRFRAVPGTESLVGSTSAGSAVMQYKKWAVPIMRSLTTDTKTLVADLRGKPPGEALTSREAREIYRFIGLTSAVLAVGAMASADDDRDRSAIGKLKKRVYREALTLMQGVDPKLWLATPRMIVWITKLGENLHALVTLEKTKGAGSSGRSRELKGAKGLVNQFTPGILRSPANKKENR